MDKMVNESKEETQSATSEEQSQSEESVFAALRESVSGLLLPIVAEATQVAKKLAVQTLEQRGWVSQEEMEKHTQHIRATRSKLTDLEKKCDELEAQIETNSINPKS